MKRYALTLALAATLAGPLMQTAHAQPSAQPSARVQAASRAVEFNGRPLDARGLQVLRQIDAAIGVVPDGRYWYDPASGGAGVWGGPAAAYLGPGLPLGGPLPAEASGGGNGRSTGVFVNGRELHRIDVQGLAQIIPVVPGRYWWDPTGNVGAEGGPTLFNFYALLAQKQSASNFHHRSDPSRGKSTYVGKGCAAVHGRLRSSDESSSYSYYVGC